MRFGRVLTVNWMARNNRNILLWLDIHFRGWWYVLNWTRGDKPYGYRSKDATPPCGCNRGSWLFGRQPWREGCARCEGPANKEMNRKEDGA